MSLVSN